MVPPTNPSVSQTALAESDRRRLPHAPDALAVKALRLVPRLIISLAVLISSLLAPSPAFATDRPWTGSTNTTWSTAGNWTGGAPGNTDNAVFNGTFTNQPNLTANSTIGGIWMTGTVGQNVTISASSGTLSLAGNTINGTAGLGILMDNTSASTLTINAPLKITNAQTWTNNSSNLLTIGTGGVDLNNKAFTINGSGNTTISGVATGAGAFTKAGSGTLTLSGTNTFTGVLTVQAGNLSIATINNDNANGTMGKSSTAVILGNTGGVTGTLQYTGATASSTKKFTMATGGTGAFQVDNAATNLTLSGVINGSGDMLKIGAGTLTLSGTNTFTGQLTVGEGTLATSAINNDNTNGTLGKSTNSVVLGGSGGVTGTLEYTGTTATSTKRFTLATGGTGAFQVDTAGTTLTSSGVIDGSGSMNKTGAGTLVLNAANTYSGGTNISNGTLKVGNASGIPSGVGKGDVVINGGATTAGTLDIGGLDVGINGLSGASGAVLGTVINSTTATNKTLAVGNNNATSAFAGLIKDNNGTGGTLAVTKVGTGTLTLSGANTFSGQLSVQAGALAIGTINNASANGVLGNSANSVILGSTGGVTGTLEYTGASAGSNKKFTLATGGTGAFQVNTAGTNLTASGVIDGGGNMSKTGAGTMTVTGTNTYTGTTSVTGGTLQVGAGGAGRTGSGATTVGDGTNAAALAGSGTVGGTANVTNHEVKAAATLKPGDAAGGSNGALTFEGNLKLNPNSVTQLQITGATTSTSRTFAGTVVGSANYIAFVGANVAAWNSATPGNHDLLNIQGTLTLGTNATGSIQILDNGYTSTAQRGDIFDLLDWNSVTAGSFNAGTNYRTSGLGGGDLMLPDLAPLGLAWDVQAFTSHGILIVVPEPSRAMLMGGAIAWFLVRRRRVPRTELRLTQDAVFRP